ncbi:hypothetical protein [Kibdelosporangium philippinense]|uniref:hypothetical protein n=1 Tax=Kibdelosporangium philippinense TaxID=211113 RepID=UPI003621CFF3
MFVTNKFVRCAPHEPESSHAPSAACFSTGAAIEVRRRVGPATLCLTHTVQAA